jgi:hypothetical protein
VEGVLRTVVQYATLALAASLVRLSAVRRPTPASIYRSPGWLATLGPVSCVTHVSRDKRKEKVLSSVSKISLQDQKRSANLSPMTHRHIIYMNT